MLYSEIIAVCSQIHTKHTNTVCGQNVEWLKKTRTNKGFSGSEGFSSINWCSILCCYGSQHENSELEKPHSQMYEML